MSIQVCLKDLTNAITLILYAMFLNYFYTSILRRYNYDIQVIIRYINLLVLFVFLNKKVMFYFFII